MTTAIDTEPAHLPMSLDLLRMQLRDLATAFGSDCFIEEVGGDILAHAVRPDLATPAVVRTVLAERAQFLHAELTMPTTWAVTTAGPIQAGKFDGQVAHVVPVAAGRECVGWWWLIGPGTGVEPDALAQAARHLADQICALEEVNQSSLSRVLDGTAPVPASFGRERPLQMVGIRPLEAGVSIHLLARVVRRTFRGIPVTAVVGTASSMVRALVLSSDGDIVREVEAVLAEVERTLGLPVVAGVAPVAATARSVGFQAASTRAMEVASVVQQPGRCRTLAAARSDVVLERLRTLMCDPVDLGPDPLQRLLKYDARHRGSYARTLLAWLDAHGDAHVAAARVVVHTNTLRYRIRRAQEVLGVELADPSVRLELHLRLRNLARPYEDIGAAK